MLIAIEGIDGSGKGTHAQHLHDALKNNGIPSKLLTFPNYGSTFFGKQVGRYLNGDFGDLNSVPVELSAMLYAGDRYEMRQTITESLDNGFVVICDRYTPSNLAHQTAKMPADRQDDFIAWLEELEYGIYKLPKADIVFWLDMPVDIAMRFVLKKNKRNYTDKKMDLHEASASYLTSVQTVYSRLSSRSNWVPLECAAAGNAKTIESIQKDIVDSFMSQYEKSAPPETPAG